MTDKDGFDLLEYPCTYTFKAMCRNHSTAIDAVKGVFADFADNSAENNGVSFDINQSGKGNYVSISATIVLLSRVELELAYKQLHAHEQVLMTL